MKILILTDLEGVAGVVDFGPDIDGSGGNYPRNKQLLTAEVNAAVAGFQAAGGTEFLVVDGHGAGAVDYMELNAPARLFHGRPAVPIRQWGDFIRGFDAAAFIGQHGMAGLRDGNLNHTQCRFSIDYYELNGRRIGEIAQFALFAGAFDIPVIFLTGHRAACDEIAALIPGVTTAEVKIGIGRNCAISLARSDVHALISRQAEAALRRHADRPLPPLQWPGPYVLEKRFFHTDAADAAASAPGAERIDAQTVRLHAAEITEIVYA